MLGKSEVVVIIVVDFISDPKRKDVIVVGDKVIFDLKGEYVVVVAPVVNVDDREYVGAVEVINTVDKDVIVVVVDGEKSTSVVMIVARMTGDL